MGTFHHDRGALHGITVVVELLDGGVWVGRCDTVDAEGVHLLDADHHPGGDAAARAAWLSAAASLGVWPHHPRTLVPASAVARVRRLVELRP